MPLSAGDKLGPYEILSAIGAGGMGEVYKARDTRLDRSVAIKVLPEHIAKREDLRTRFEREARAVASLNHPHICVLFDIGQQDDADYMVMECLEGETLAARVRRGALPLDLALKFAIQIADALDRAHRTGVVHRDLKPSNLMLTRDGVKVLDFGLARTAHGPNDATLKALTTSGALLGTPQYMSPEQWEGKQADERSDVFGFGCVVYEMVTGRRAFENQSGWGPDPPPMSPSRALQELVSVCLAKDPEERWQSMRDVLLQLRSIAHAPRENAMAASGTHRWRWGGIGIAAGIGLLSALAGWLARPSEPVHTYQVSINPPDGGVFLSGLSNVAISPDGTLLAFVARTDGKARLWVRRLDSPTARSLPGTEGASSPFWSPDSLHVGFFTSDKLKRIEVAQGTPQTLCDAVNGRGGSWNVRGDIVFAAFSTGRALHRVGASGGASAPITTLDSVQGDVFHFWPHFLPDGRHYLYLARTAKPETTGIRVGMLGAPLRREDALLTTSVSNAAYAAPAQSGWIGKGSGHLFFLRDHTLLAQAFDPAELEVKGDPIPIAEHVGYSRAVGLGDFSPSSNGTLAYGSASGLRSQLVWRDRRGKQLGTLDTGSDFSAPSLSPDGKRLAFSRMDPASGNQDIWVGEIGRATASRLTSHPSFDGDPAWSPDGSQVAFTSQASGVYNLYRKSSNGAGEPERLAGGPLLQHDSDWSRDGRFLLFTEDGGKKGADLMILPLAGKRKYSPFLQTQFGESQGRFSPDGQWIAYTSNETGTDEVYVQSFVPGQPASGDRWKISAGGGRQARWRWDGRELFYLSPQYEMKAASVTPGGASFQAGPPTTLFSTKVPTRLATWHYDVTRDGERFILLESLEEIAKPVTLVINWLAGTRR